MTYGLMKDATLVGYELETTDGTDPANTRVRWPGWVLSVGTVTEEYGHRRLTPLGSQTRSAHAFIKTTEQFEVEINSLLNDPFVNTSENDIIRLALGKIGTRIDHDSVVGGPFVVAETITGGTSSATGVVVLVGTGFLLYTVTAGTMQNAEVLTGGTSGATANSTTAPDDGQIEETADCHLDTFTLELGWTGTNPFFYLLRGCKVKTATLTFRPDDLISLRVNIMGRLGTFNTTEVNCSLVDLSELTQSILAPAHWKDMTLTWEDGSGSSLGVTPQVMELDLTIENNLTRIPFDNQLYVAGYLQEGDREISVAVKTVRQDNSLLDIFRGDPAVAAGQVHLKVVINPGSAGFQMDFDMGVDTAGIYLDLREHENPMSQDQSFLEESFALMLRGDPVVDMRI